MNSIQTSPFKTCPLKPQPQIKGSTWNQNFLVKLGWVDASGEESSRLIGPPNNYVMLGVETSLAEVRFSHTKFQIAKITLGLGEVNYIYIFFIHPSMTSISFSGLGMSPCVQNYKDPDPNPYIIGSNSKDLNLDQKTKWVQISTRPCFLGSGPGWF